MNKMIACIPHSLLMRMTLPLHPHYNWICSGGGRSSGSKGQIPKQMSPVTFLEIPGLFQNL